MLRAVLWCSAILEGEALRMVNVVSRHDSRRRLLPQRETSAPKPFDSFPTEMLFYE